MSMFNAIETYFKNLYEALDARLRVLEDKLRPKDPSAAYSLELGSPLNENDTSGPQEAVTQEAVTQEAVTQEAVTQEP